MKRSDFIKNVFTLIAVPALGGGLVAVTPFDEKVPQVLNEADSIRFYGNKVDKFRLGDIIVSDMGDKACIVRIIHIGDKYAEAKPVIRGRFRYRDINAVCCMSNAIRKY